MYTPSDVLAYRVSRISINSTIGTYSPVAEIRTASRSSVTAEKIGSRASPVLARGGEPSLDREWGAAFATRRDKSSPPARRGVVADPERIVVTGGASHRLSVIWGALRARGARRV